MALTADLTEAMPLYEEQRIMATIRKEIEQLKQELVEWRHSLHSYPETAFEEEKTGDFLTERLRSFGFQVNRGLAKTGIVATLSRGDGNQERSVAFRADMDALNIEEQNRFAYCSKNPGKMHACGHDGHMTMLLGAAKILSRLDSFIGTIHLIFQPAEENEGGGGVMVEQGLFDAFPARAVFGMHNFPMLPAGTFAICPGPMMAAYDVFDITITGVGGHAAIPQLTRDPIVTAAGIITQLQTLVSRNTNPLEAAVVSVTEVHGGTAYNIIPDQVLLRGTTRHFKPEIQQLIQSRMSEVIQGMATATGVEVELRYTTRYPALVNTETETAMAVQAATAVAGAKEVSSHLQPLMGSEDFAFMLEKVPGAYIGIGSGSPGNATNLHQATYDFNDEILTLGVEYWVTLAERLLSR